MFSRKIFHLLVVVGGAVAGATSGCATTSGSSDSGSAKPAQSIANPGTSMPSGGGVRGW